MEMTPIRKAALRCAKLQELITIDRIVDMPLSMKITQRHFIEAFPQGQHLFDKLTQSHDVSVWLRSLDEGNERIFFESEHFDFLS